MISIYHIKADCFIVCHLLLHDYLVHILFSPAFTSSFFFTVACDGEAWSVRRIALGPALSNIKIR